MQKKTDSNQKEIVAAFRNAGATVFHVHMVGHGFPDIIVGYHGKNYLIEIKDGKKVKSARKLTPDEEIFHSTWRGHVAIVESVEDVIKIINFVK